MEKEVVLKVENVKKKYQLGVIGGGTLQGDLQSWWAKIRGKEDPNKKIGEENSFSKDTFYALKGINFDVKKGERLGIIGGNGAGKSTTLKILSRVTAPTEGKVFVRGRISSMLEVGTGFHPELTGRENIYLNGAILGMNKAEVEKKMEAIIEFSECRQFIDTPVKRYSSGMYVKLAFAVAAHLDSEILIMDEVLAVGDMAFQKKCINKMNEVATNEGRTVLYVSHNMNTIRQLCDRCIVLKNGELIYDGDVEEAIATYMNNNEERALSYDYTLTKRSPQESRKLQFVKTDIDNSTNAQIEIGENLELTIHCVANEDVEEFGIRFELFSLDDMVVGTMFANKKISALKGQRLEVKINIPTNNLAKGKYKVVALFYEENEYGYQLGVDRVEPALFFEIVDNSPNSILWPHQYWGYVKFDDMEINEIIVLDS